VNGVLDNERAVDDDGGARAARELVRIGIGGAIGEIRLIENRCQRGSLVLTSRDP
jgi:hypothetical protein